MNNKKLFCAYRSSIFLFALLFVVSGCSWLPSWMGGEKKEEPKLAGTRIDVLPASEDLKIDETLKNTPITLPAPLENADWPQHSGNVSAANSNLALKGMLSNVTSASAGDGEEFIHTLIPAPVVADGTVFSMDAAGKLSARDAADISTRRWLSKGVFEKHTPDVLGGGLAYDQGKLYVTSGIGAVAALDAKTGNVLWRKELRIPIPSAPRVAGDKLFIVTIDNEVFALNVATGDVIWNQRGIDETASLMNAVSPVVAGEEVIAPYSSGELHVLAIADGNEIWKDSLAQNSHAVGAPFSGIGGDPVVDAQVVIADSSGGVLSVSSLVQGQRVWEKPVSSNNVPWVAGDYLFVLTTDQTLICFYKYDGRIRWTLPLPGYKNMEKKKEPLVWRGPVLVNGNLALVNSNEQLVLVSATDGKIVDTKEIAENIYTAPVVAGGRMYLISQDATLYELQ